MHTTAHYHKHRDINTHMLTLLLIYIDTRKYTCMKAQVHAHTETATYRNRDIYIHILTYIHTYIQVHIPAHTLTHTHTHKHTLTCI